MKAFSAVEESVFRYGHLMLGAVPLPDQHGPGAYANLLGRSGSPSAGGGIVGDSLQQPQSHRFETPKGFLLKPICNRLNQQRGTEFRRRVSTEQRLPLLAQFRGVHCAESIQL